MKTINKDTFAPNVQMGLVIVVTTLLYLFFGLSGGSYLQHSTYYLLMFLGSVVGAYVVFGEQMGEKLKFTTMNVPLTNVVLYGALLGIMLATLETFSAGNTVFIQQSVTDSNNITSNIVSDVTLLISTITFVMLFSTITSISEETLTRGFLASVAENYADSETTEKISKYVLIPLIFSLLHYFMWARSGMIDIAGIFGIVFLLMYHFVFAVICQFSMEVTGSIYTPIVMHAIYNSIKMLMAVGIIAVGA